MKYLLLIHQGDTPTPQTDAWDRLSDEEQNEVYAAYKAVRTGSPVVELNRAAAMAEAGEVESALALAESLELDRYHYLHAARAELLCRLDRIDDARAAYDRALELVHSDAERRFLEGRRAELLER